MNCPKVESPFATKLLYRAEIDGLRAIAVIVVVLFHAGLGVTGGYVGVDVFFVISGFLITSIIVRDLNHGSFALVDFWERRARRILPAMIVVVLSTVIAGWFLLLPLDFINLGRSTTWQAVFGANIHFWRDSGYFTGAAEEKALLHTWSLAVEEQFYMVAPLLLWAVYLFTKSRSNHIMIGLVVVGIMISLAVSIYGVAHYPAATFYLLPTRAWELLIGALVALVSSIGCYPKSNAVREAMALTGLVGLILPCFFYTKTTPFPGLAAIPPCVGTALFIWACTIDLQRQPDIRRPFVARCVAIRPLVGIGLISYSLYLWHWPLFAFSKYWSIVPMTLPTRFGLVFVGLLIAVLSWRFVETPFRKRQLCGGRSSMFQASGLGIIAVFVSGIIVMSGNGFPQRLPSAAVQFANAKDDKENVHECDAHNVLKNQLIALGNSDSNAQIDLLLWGDSHGMAAAPAVDIFLREKGLSGRQATASATAPFVNAYWPSEYTTLKSAAAFNNAVLDYVDRHQIPNVLLVGFWENYANAPRSKDFEEALVSTIVRLREIGAKPFVLLQVPRQRVDVPKALAMNSVFGYDLSPHLLGSSEWTGIGSDSKLLRRIQSVGGHILDPIPYFLNHSSQRFIIEKDGVSIYRDKNHLSAAGAKLLLTPCLRATLILQDSADKFVK